MSIWKKLRKPLGWFSSVMVIAGSIVWGLVGVANFNLVETLLGVSFWTKLVYSLVGLSGFYMIYFLATMKHR
jgi:hypothetical protein